jgi:hypothetical protein
MLTRGFSRTESFVKRATSSRQFNTLNSTALFFPLCRCRDSRRELLAIDCSPQLGLTRATHCTVIIFFFFSRVSHACVLVLVVVCGKETWPTVCFCSFVIARAISWRGGGAGALSFLGVAHFGV